jgi:low affinity Fe/Cu permease
VPQDQRGAFDEFADITSRQVSRAWFFVACCLLVVLWAPTIFLGLSVDTWQLIINTLTTIVTFLMVALLQNSTQRAEDAANVKLDAILELLGELSETSTTVAERAKGIEKKIGT